MWITIPVGAKFLMKMGAFWGLVPTFACLASIASAQSEIVPTAPHQYRLRYSVRSFQVSDPKQVRYGTFEVAESVGHLIMSYAGDAALPFSFYYDGKISLTSLGKRQGNYEEGYAWSDLPWRPILPFNFARIDIICPRLASSNRKPEAMPVDTVGVKIRQSTMKGYGPFADGSCSFEDPRMKLVSELKYGPLTYPLEEFRYSGYTSSAGFLVPSSILMTELKQRQTADGHRESYPVTQHEMKLESASSNPGPATQFELDRQLAAGMLISYAGERGNAGFFYDPSAGPFNSQLDKGIDSAQRHVGQVSMAPGKPQGNTNIPYILTGVFGIAAIFFLFKGKKVTGKKKGSAP